MLDYASLYAERIGGRDYGKSTAIYKFEKIKRAKRAALAANPGAELIDLGVGEPDEMAPDPIVEALVREARLPENRGYSDNGIAEFKQAGAAWLERVYGVTGIDPEREVMHGIGSKPVLAMLPLALINPGDIALMTVPGYPVFGTHTAYLGGAVHRLPLLPENRFLPDLDSIPADVLAKAKALVLNYPNNPTGRGATADFFTRVVAFAKKHNIVIIHDAAYAALVYDRKPLSFLSIPGAKEVGVEIHSLSKSYNMTGWRIAFVAGNANLVAAYGDVKDNTDSGQFKAIQKAACAALADPGLTAKIAEKYERRLRRLVLILRGIGFDAEMSDGSFFLYMPAPKGTRDGRVFANAEEFSQYLITEKLISTVPYDDCGACVRVSATFECRDRADEERVLGEIEKRLADLAPVF